MPNCLRFGATSRTRRTAIEWSTREVAIVSVGPAIRLPVSCRWWVPAIGPVVLKNSARQAERLTLQKSTSQIAPGSTIATLVMVEVPSNMLRKKSFEFLKRIGRNFTLTVPYADTSLDPLGKCARAGPVSGSSSLSSRSLDDRGRRQASAADLGGVISRSDVNSRRRSRVRAHRRRSRQSPLPVNPRITAGGTCRLHRQ